MATLKSNPIPFPHKQYGMYYVEEDFRDAAYRGDFARIKEIINKYPKLNINATNEYNETALYIACKKNQNQIAEFLLQQPGIKANIATVLGNSAVLISAWNDNTEQVKILDIHGADLHARTNPDREYHGNVSALDIAQERGNKELVKYLQERLAVTAAPSNNPRP